MKTLYELITFLPNSFKPHFAERLNKLYLFLKKHKNLTAKEAALLYLGNENRIKYFHILKNDLKKELIQFAILNIPRGEYPDKTIQEESYKTFAMYKIFLLNSLRQAGIELAENLLPKLHTLELYSLARIVADDLLTHYSVIDIKKHLQKKYRKIGKEALLNTKDFALVKEYYNQVISICNTRESYNQAIIEEFITIEKAIRPLLKKGRHNINRFIYIIIVCRYIAVHDYEKINQYCDKALGSFPKNHPMIRSLSVVFLFHKITALIPLGKTIEAKQIARDALAIVAKGKFNWHMLLLKRIIACLHGGEYQEAYQLYKAQQKKKCPYPIVSEYWNIIKGYLHFLIEVQLIHPYDNEKFYLGKFMNETPLYSKDKAGNNINILLIQTLIQLKRAKFTKIIDRIDAIQEYARVYTRSEECKRVNLFIKMIIKMESARFHRKGTELKTKKLLEKLKNTPLKMEQNLAIEIVPYEVLWSEILDIIDNKFRAIKINKKKPINKDI